MKGGVSSAGCSFSYYIECIVVSSCHYLAAERDMGWFTLPSSIQHLSNDDCLENKSQIPLL